MRTKDIGGKGLFNLSWVFVKLSKHTAALTMFRPLGSCTSVAMDHIGGASPRPGKMGGEMCQGGKLSVILRSLPGSHTSTCFLPVGLKANIKVGVIFTTLSLGNWVHA